MDFNIPPVGGVERNGTAPRTAPTQGDGFSAALNAAVNVSTLPASPPPAALEDMHVAARVFDELRAQKRELHFEQTDNGSVIVQLRDLEGNVIRTIPPAKALEVATGAPLEG